MAWNRPEEGSGNREQGTGKRNRRKTCFRGLAAAVAVVFLGVIVLGLARWVNRTGEMSDRGERRRGAIKDVGRPGKRAAETNAVETVAKVSAATNAPVRKKWWTKRHVGDDDRPVYTNKTYEAKGRYEVFKTYPENVIASFLTTPPGTMFLGTCPNYSSKRFLDQLRKSFDTPVEILPDDPEDVRQVKEMVEEEKADLKARMAAGEDVGKLLMETRNEMQRLGLYRRQLEEQLKEVRRNPDMSEQDVDDFVAAANTLLERNGIAPIKLTAMQRKAIKFQKSIQSEKIKDKLREMKK